MPAGAIIDEIVGANPEAVLFGHSGSASGPPIHGTVAGARRVELTEMVLQCRPKALYRLPSS
jgi:hypothetical protein